MGYYSVLWSEDVWGMTADATNQLRLYRSKKGCMLQARVVAIGARDAVLHSSKRFRTAKGFFAALAAIARETDFPRFDEVDVREWLPEIESMDEVLAARIAQVVSVGKNDEEDLDEDELEEFELDEDELDENDD